MRVANLQEHVRIREEFIRQQLAQTQRERGGDGVHGLHVF